MTLGTVRTEALYRLEDHPPINFVAISLGPAGQEVIGRHFLVVPVSIRSKSFVMLLTFTAREMMVETGF